MLNKLFYNYFFINIVYQLRFIYDIFSEKFFKFFEFFCKSYVTQSNLPPAFRRWGIPSGGQYTTADIMGSEVLPKVQQ